MAGGGFVPSGNKGKNYPGKLTGQTFLICVAAACGGLIFGYDIGISGGVTTMPVFLQKFFPRVYDKEQSHDSSHNSDQYCKFDDPILTLFTSSLYLAAILSSCVASWVTRSFGRKRSMLLGGFLFLAGAAINAAAFYPWMLILGRVLLGFGIGFANQAAPVYLSEMAPYRLRGACNMLFQLSITIGILAANLLNVFTATMGDHGWRISLGGAAVPALIFIFCTFFLPDSPNSLMERGLEDEAKARLIEIRGTKDVDEEFKDLQTASIESQRVKHPWRNLFQRKHRPHLTFVTLIPAFQQLTGMNVIMFYAPVLYKTLGFGANLPLYSACITGGVNAVSTFVSILTVDKVGRRFLFLEGGTQMLFCQIATAALIGWKFGIHGNPGNLSQGYATLVVTIICIYVAGFAWSWGPLGWLVPCEILPLEIRSAGQTVNVVVNMLFTFFVAEIFTKMLCKFKFGLFIFFAFFVVLMITFIYFFFPETKGKPIEEMQGIWKAHPRWRKYVVEDGEGEGDGDGDGEKSSGGNGGDVPKLPCQV